MRAAIELGHEYVALTDHSPRLKVANGLTPERLREQLDVVAALNEELAPFRILTRHRGRHPRRRHASTRTTSCSPELDVVVASVHSKLRMDERAMTDRMVAAVANPHVDILGHCTGRLVLGRGRPESEFDAELVFTACREFDTAVEINSRPERLDPPRRLLEPRGRDRGAVLDRQRRPRTRPALVAALRLRARRRVRGPRGAHRQHLGRRQPPRLDREPRLTDSLDPVGESCGSDPRDETHDRRGGSGASSQTTAPSWAARASVPSTRSPSWRRVVVRRTSPSTPSTVRGSSAKFSDDEHAPAPRPRPHAVGVPGARSRRRRCAVRGSRRAAGSGRA